MKSILTLIAAGGLGFAASAQTCDQLLVSYKACENENGVLPVGLSLREDGERKLHVSPGAPSDPKAIEGKVGDGVFGVTGFTEADTFDVEESYLSFDIESRDGEVVSVTGIDLRYFRDVGGPRKLVLRSSADGYQENLFADASISESPEFNFARFDTPIEGTQVSFRLYLYDAGVGDYNGVFNLEPFDGNPNENALQFKGCLLDNLPVELTDFSVTAVGDVAELNWATATELDNDFFAVEHSVDGVAFAEVGRVTGAGTTSARRYYNFSHLTLVGGTHYFRLRQVDFDGQTSYSDIVAVDFAGVAALALTNTVVQDELIVNSSTATSYRVISLSGDVALAGQLRGGREALDVSALAPGVYVLTDGVTSLRFVR